jgi:hypothetical protein
MFILKECEKISIVTSQDALMGKSDRVRILFNRRLYDAETFKCVSDSTRRILEPSLRHEYLANKEEAVEKLRIVRSSLAKQPVTSAVPAAVAATPAPTSGGFGDQLQEIMLKVLAEQSADKVVEFAKPLIEEHIIKTFGVLPQLHEVKLGDKVHKVEGVLHEKFDQILQLVALQIPVYLSGDAGTGKNVICKQIADALGTDFYFTNAVTQEYQLKGFTDANGTYHETQFYKAFTKGGLFFLDEMDGSVPEALIILNSAIANGYFDFPAPIGKVMAHEGFRIVSAGNTVGTGADIEYTGRFQLDASSLDRFALIEVGYSPAIEEAITGKNEELCRFAREFRKITQKCSIKCLFTYRSLERISKLEERFELSDVLKMALTKGLGKDDLRIITKGFDDAKFDSKYVRALKAVKVN